MPIFLLPSNYSASTVAVPLSEATNGKKDQYVATTMEEVRVSLTCEEEELMGTFRSSCYQCPSGLRI